VFDRQDHLKGHRPGRTGLPAAAPRPGVLRFFKQVAKTYPRVKMHLVVDNYATYRHSAVKAWPARNP
jgi:hypothetical protein